jgi:hypothetical protein
MPVEKELSARDIANRIRYKVKDLNDELLLASLAEVEVEFMINTDADSGCLSLRVWCGQEI